MTATPDEPSTPEICDRPTPACAAGAGSTANRKATCNSHFACTCYHPLFVFNQFGDVERCALRPGNVYSADCWRAMLEPVIAQYRGSQPSLKFPCSAPQWDGKSPKTTENPANVGKNC